MLFLLLITWLSFGSFLGRFWWIGFGVGRFAHSPSCCWDSRAVWKSFGYYLSLAPSHCPVYLSRYPGKCSTFYVLAILSQKQMKNIYVRLLKIATSLVVILILLKVSHLKTMIYLQFDFQVSRSYQRQKSLKSANFALGFVMVTRSSVK